MGSMVPLTIRGRFTPASAHRAHDADGRRLEVERVLGGLEQQRVDPTLDEGAGLCVVTIADLVEGHVAGHGDRAGAGAHRPDCKARPGGGHRVAVNGLARQTSGGERDVVASIGKAIFTKHIRGTSEGIGRDEVRTRVEVGGVNGGDHVGAREVQVLVTALVLRPRRNPPRRDSATGSWCPWRRRGRAPGARRHRAEGLYAPPLS